MRKLTILFGAGAASPWRAPSTKLITEAIEQDTDITVREKPLGRWIIDTIQNGNNNLTANFETYVDFLESVYLLLSKKTDNRVINQNIYEIRPEVLQGVKEIKFKNGSQFDSDCNTIKACFYSLIRIVKNKIVKYLNNYGDTNNELNHLLRLFIEYFIKLGHSVRSYSLNYDRSIPLVFESVNSSHEIFDGFDIENKKAEFSKLFTLNRRRLLEDIYCNSFFNLHGSCHWSFQEIDYKLTSSLLPFTLMSAKQYKYVPEAFIDDYSIDVNPNERILLTPIITGYRKIQRVNLEPFNYFFHSFFRDIQESELIIIIGYSFSDPHINHLLREALRQKTKIYNIGYKPSYRNCNSITSDWGQVLRNNYPTLSNWYRDEEFFYSEFINGFEEFLMKEEWFRIKPI